jgi:hypothetical protein
MRKLILYTTTLRKITGRIKRVRHKVCNGETNRPMWSDSTGPEEGLLKGFVNTKMYLCFIKPCNFHIVCC